MLDAREHADHLDWPSNALETGALAGPPAWWQVSEDVIRRDSSAKRLEPMPVDGDCDLDDCVVVEGYKRCPSMVGDAKKLKEPWWSVSCEYRLFSGPKDLDESGCDVREDATIVQILRLTGRAGPQRDERAMSQTCLR